MSPEKFRTFKKRAAEQITQFTYSVDAELEPRPTLLPTDVSREDEDLIIICQLYFLFRNKLFAFHPSTLCLFPAVDV